MTVIIDTAADPDVAAEEARLDAAHGFATLRATGTLPDGAGVTVVQRIPGDTGALVLSDPEDDDAVDPAGAAQLRAVLDRHPGLTTVVDIRSPHLVAWAQTGQSLPIRYVPVQRWTLAAEIPILTDRVGRSVALADFVDEVLAANRHTPAVLVQGAVVWGRQGLLRTLEYAQLVEEGAQFQTLAQPLGGSLPVGPGVLLQQWRMSGLESQARAEGLLPDV